MHIYISAKNNELAAKGYLIELCIFLAASQRPTTQPTEVRRDPVHYLEARDQVNNLES